MSIKITWDILPIVGVASVLLAWYIPGFKDWYAKLESANKQAFMAVMLFVIAALGSLASLVGISSIYPVDQGWQGLVVLPLIDFLAALIANAGIYKSTNYILGPKE